MSDSGFCERTAQVAIREPDSSISCSHASTLTILVLMLSVLGGRDRVCRMETLGDGMEGTHETRERATQTCPASWPAARWTHEIQCLL